MNPQLITCMLTMEFTAPPAPSSAQQYLPQDVESFGEGLWYVLKTAIVNLNPSLTEATQVCLWILAAVLLLSLINSFSGIAKQATQLAGTVAVALLLLRPTASLISLGVSTVQEMSEYGKLLLPVMTAALAAQGGVTSSAALYTGTVFFDTVLTSAISNLIVPLLYVYLALCVANSALAQDLLKNLANLIKWVMTWFLKIILYVFTGYIGITGVVSGTADAATVKAAKIAITGAVPIVGSIISDASETIIVSAGVMKSTAGVFGLLVIVAIWIGPFLEIAVQYILIKLTLAVCSAFGNKPVTALIKGFAEIMGFLLAAIGAMCLLHLISTVCLMRGVS